MSKTSDELSSYLVGKKCRDFRLLEGGTLILYLDPGERRANDSVKGRLWLNCAWRLRNSEQVIIGSLDSPELILDALNSQLVKRVLTSVKIDDLTKDIRLLFLDDLAIDGFSFFTDDELWEFRGSDGFRFGVGPNLVPFQRYEAPD